MATFCKGLINGHVFVSHVQDWVILSKSHVGDPIEVRKDECQASGLHMQDHDEPAQYRHGRHLERLF